MQGHQRPCGRRAPTTPASPPRWWWSASCNAEGKTRHDSAARPSSSACGNGTSTPAAPSPASCDAWAPRWTGAASASPWTRVCPRPSRRCSCACIEEGLIYRGKRLVNWDPVLHTAVSDLEVLSQEESGHLWHMRYPLSNGPATWWWPPPARRPCSATAPWRSIRATNATSTCSGELVELPLTGRRIPIIADEELRRPGIRHRLRQDHPGSRLQRLRRVAAPSRRDRHQLPAPRRLINIFTADAAIRPNDAG